MWFIWMVGYAIFPEVSKMEAAIFAREALSSRMGCYVAWKLYTSYCNQQINQMPFKKTENNVKKKL